MELILVCPKCGREYYGDPSQPNAYYECETDQTQLRRLGPEEPTIVLPPPPPPPPAPDVTLQIVAEEPPPAPPARTPTSFETKYEVVSELGRGGMGQVLRVRDRDLNREVAMKKLLPHAKSSDELSRFMEEAQATGQLEHPNIVPVHDLGVDADGRTYFTLKFVEGRSLKQVLQNRDQHADVSTPLRMIEMLVSICQAVAYAHSKKIIHRDLKPENVMLGKYGEVLVMDWGLAKVIGGKETMEEGSIAGTPSYMAPEQAAGKISQLDQRSDIYSLGAILYEMVSGAAPYQGGTALEIVARVRKEAPPTLRRMKGAAGFQPIARELIGISEKAMARRPADRYATADAMRDDLQAYLENLPVSAAPDNVWQRLEKWAKRNRRQVQSGAVSAATVLILVLAAWFGWRSYRIFQFNTLGEQRLTQARDQYRYQAPQPTETGSDPYADQRTRAMMAQRAGLFRTALQQAMDPLRRALDIAPNNREARSLMADANMELWRIAMYEQNTELAKVTREQVESLAPDPSLYSAELNGYGSVIAGFDAADAEVFLFRFEPVQNPLRLIPVPYDAKTRQLDVAFLASEQARIAAGKPVAVDRHSIFNLEPTPSSRVGAGAKIVIPELPPGSYMMLVRATGRIDVRISLRLDRLGRVQQDYILPKTEDNPAGFFYMAGGDVTIGGDNAGAPARHNMKIEPAWIYHDEISMGEYAAYLHDLIRSGKSTEARQRLPKDFGRNLATLSAAGEMIPAESGIDPVAFAKSPVRGVSFNDAQAYVTWRGQKEGLPYRLPKDWEWEAACRGADGRRYSWGDVPGKGLAVVTQGYGDTGSSMSWKWEDYKDESPWGIHNLAGGAAEWTMSPYDAKAKPADPVFGQLAIRGNAWALPPVGLECDFRTSGQPDYFHPTIGFRMALDHPYTRTGPQ